MKNADILKILYDKGQDFVSGEEMANIFNISRAAISKRIEKLKDKGIVIEAITNKGYKLVSIPDRAIQDSVFLGVKDGQLVGNDIIVFDEIDSTNEESKKIAKNSGDGTVIISNSQTKGKGRRGRTFISKEGGLYFTIIMKPNVSIDKVPFLTQVSACSIFKALDSFGVKTKIKWPNDILIKDKKISGILCEMSCELDYLIYAIAGIGINVEHIDFDDDIKDIATSLETEKYSLKKMELFWKVLEYFEYYYKKFKLEDYEEMIEILRENSYILGKDINIISGNSTKNAKAIDIDNKGFLIVEYEDGAREALNYGEVSIKKSNA